MSGPRDEYTYYPNTSDIPEGVAPNIRNRSFRIAAQIQVTDAASGVVVAQGSRFGGHSLFLKEGRPYYAYNFLGIEEQLVAAPTALTVGHHTLVAEFLKEKEDPPAVAHGALVLTVDGVEVARGEIRTQPGKFSLSGEGLSVGRDTADPVSKEYPAEFKPNGLTIDHVTITLEGEQYANEELEALGMLARE